MSRIIFSLDDVKDPPKLERVLQQFRTAVETPIMAAPTKFSAQSVDVGSLAGEIAKLVQPELQATGKAPLNITNLLPGGTIGFGLPLNGPHSVRLATNPAALEAGTLFMETDRHAVYMVSNVSGSLVWLLITAYFSSVRSNVPLDLGQFDAGFVFQISDYSHTAVWDGAAYHLADGGSAYFIDSPFALGTGWQLCDGTVTDYIVNNTTNLPVASFTTPNENGSPGTYHGSIVTYTGVINAPASPTVSANTGSSSSGVTLNKVTDNVPNAGADTVLDTATSITDPGHLHTFAATVTLPGDPIRNLGVLRYFRR